MEKNYETLYKSKKLNKVFDTLEELKEEEAKYDAALKEKEEKSLLVKADVVKVQDAANAYLKLVEAHKKAQLEMTKEEETSYKEYKKVLNEFADKHQGYRLIYTINGDNVEFKIEETRTNEFDRIRKEQNERIKKFFDNFFSI